MNGSHLEEELERNGVFYTTTEGDSMAPILHTHRNTIVLRKPRGRARKNDVIVVRREDGHLVMHRVVRVTETGYITRGDNRRKNDPFAEESSFIALLDGYYRGKKYIPVTSRRYRLYVALWGRPNPVRAVFLFFKFGFAKVARTLRGKPKN